jgi:hypothetical protein
MPVSPGGTDAGIKTGSSRFIQVSSFVIRTSSFYDDGNIGTVNMKEVRPAIWL